MLWRAWILHALALRYGNEIEVAFVKGSSLWWESCRNRTVIGMGIKSSNISEKSRYVGVGSSCKYPLNMIG